MKLHEDMVVQSEIVERVFEEDFTTAEDKDILEDLQKKLEGLGLDPALASQVMQENQRGGRRVTASAEPFSVIPARQWEEAKTRLNEEAKRTAKLLLNRTDLKPEGGELPYKLKPALGAKNNFVGAFQMVNEGLSKRAGGNKKRSEWSTEEFLAATALLPEILDGLVREVKKLQAAKGA